MTWADALAIFIGGVLLGPLVYRVDEWEWRKLVTWFDMRWKAIVLFAVGGAAGFMLRQRIVFLHGPEHDIAAGKDPWEWGWDAWVAIGTILLAVATFATIVFAWLGERRRQIEAAETIVLANLAAANKTIFELGSAYNAFRNFREQFISPFVRIRARHFLIQPAIGMTLRTAAIEFTSLTFLFELGDPAVLGDLAMLEREIASTLEVIKERSRLHLEVVQPLVEELSALDASGRFSPAALEWRLGIRYSAILKGLTDEMINGTENAIIGTQREIESLRTAVKSIYPGRKIAAMRTIEDIATSAPPQQSGGGSLD